MDVSDDFHFIGRRHITGRYNGRMIRARSRRIASLAARWWLRLCIAAVSFSVCATSPPTRVVFGGDSAYPPFEWSQNGTPTGFNVDLAIALGDFAGVEVDHHLDDWPRTVSALASGHVDVVPMFVSDERRTRFLFTTPFYIVNHAIYAAEDAAPVHRLEELAGYKVVVERQSFAEEQLQVEGLDVVLVGSSGTEEALQMLTAAEADYAVLAATAADALIQSRHLPVRRLGPPFWPRNYAFAVHKDRPELVGWLQNTLDLLIATGRYQEVYREWEPRLEPRRHSHAFAVKVIATTIGVLAILAAAGALWSWSLRRQIEARTAELRDALRQNKVAEAQARHLADFDNTSGLPKPHYFRHLVDEHLLREPDTGRELAVVQLAELNEVAGVLGRAYSEDLIRRVALELKALTGPGCSGYLGRGVFAICINREQGWNLTRGLSERRDFASTEIHTHLIRGSAYYPEHGRSAHELLMKAETALAVCAARSQRHLVYEPSLEPDPLTFDIVTAFREGELEGLYALFQPQIDLRTGRVLGAEALVRWEHPQHGFLSPVRFIPVVEKAGLVPQVTALMIKEAIRVSAALREKGRPCVISVNVTVQDLVEIDLVSLIQEVLGAFGGVATDLKLELTETGVAEDSACIGRALSAIAELGVGLAVDDFGTGYSSLAYLSQFPFQELKIDRAFVFDMQSNSRNRSIIRSTIAMAKELDLRTVAEGAEDQATVNLLREDGCDRVQGFFFSAPLPEADFFAFIEARDAEQRE